ncbi:MAG: ERF family protein [Quinella sp. 3Q1]|nr:ERF family protein [Quinella sp. 3Q1]
MAIGKKLVAVMAACRYMPQDGYNSFQKYKYTTAAGMFAKINEAMTEQGLFVQVESTLIELRDVTTSKGNAEKHAVVSAKVTITEADTGETVTFTGLGSGQDGGDKSVMKAQTAALKYAYIGGLCIAMSDDPESDTNATYQPPRRNNEGRNW